ncbi:MAG: hypothetical protein AAB426_00190, partial [Myxococcota bacterium]
GSLDASIWGKVQLQRVRVGAPPQFSQPTLIVERLALRWSLWRLLLWTVSIDEVAVEGVRLNVEAIDGRTNLAALLRPALAVATATPPVPPPAAIAAPETTPPTPAPLSQPFVPIRVVVRDVHVRDVALHVQRPDLRVDFDGPGLEARLAAFGRGLDFDVWAGLGAHDDPQSVSTLEVYRSGRTQPLTVRQRLDVHLRSLGLGANGLRSAWTAKVTRLAPHAPPVDVHLALDADASLTAPQTVVLRQLLADVGAQTHLRARATVKSSEAGVDVTLEELTFASVLDELAPLLAAFVPGADLGGALSFEMTPTQWLASRTRGAPLPATTAQLNAHDVSAKVSGAQVRNAELALTLTSQPQALLVSVGAQVGALDAGELHVEGVDISALLELPTPTLATATLPVRLGVQTTLGGVRLPTLAVDTARVSIEGTAPMAWVLSGTGNEPLEVVTTVEVASVRAAAASLDKLRMRTRAALHDQRGDGLDVDLDGSVHSIALHQPEPRIDLRPLLWSMRASRRGDRLSLSSLRIDLADRLHMVAKADVTAFLSPSPVIETLHVHIEPMVLSRLLELVPSTLRPPLTLGGKLAVDWSAQGTVPYVDLARWATPPVPATELSWQQQLDGHWSYLERWRTAFAQHLPFETELRLTLADGAFALEGTRVRGLEGSVLAALSPTGPRLDIAVKAAQVDAQASIQDLALFWQAAVTTRGASTQGRATLGTLEHAALSAPLRNPSLVFDLAYEFSQDVLTETLRVELPAPATAMSVEGRVEHLWQTLRERSWEQPQLAGLATHWVAKLNLEAPNRFDLGTGGLALSGAISLHTAVSVKDGTATISGALETQNFSAEQPGAGVRGLSGNLPWDVELAFGANPHAVVVSHTAPMGDGILGVVAASSDVRRREARPLYYDRLRPYRGARGLVAERVYAGAHGIENLELDARIERGSIVAESIALQVLGGDVGGSVTLRLGVDGAVGGDLDFRITNLDASYFPALKLTPGSTSQLSASAQLGFMLAPGARDLTLNLNVTKIGAQTLDRFLQLLDPDGQDQKLQGTREKLWWFRTGLVRLDEVAAWVRFENLNLDLVATTFLRIPGTAVGYMPVPRELLRRYPLGEKLDVYLQPIIDEQLGPLLGWDHDS